MSAHEPPTAKDRHITQSGFGVLLWTLAFYLGFRKTLVVVTLKTRTAFLKPEKTCHAAAIPGPNGLLRCLGSRSGPDKQGGQGDLPGNRFRPIRFPLTPECLPPAAAHCRGSGRLSATCRWSSLGTHQSRCGTCRASTLWFGFRPCLWLSRRLAPCHADATQPCTHILRVSLMCACVVQDFHADAF